jgi:hypothetical protein
VAVALKHCEEELAKNGTTKGSERGRREGRKRKGITDIMDTDKQGIFIER